MSRKPGHTEQCGCLGCVLARVRALIAADRTPPPPWPNTVVEGERIGDHDPIGDRAAVEFVIFDSLRPR